MVVKSSAEEVPLKTSEVGKVETQSDDVAWFCRKRYYLVLLLFLGMVINVLLRTNLSIAIVAMTANKTVTVGNETYTIKAEFNWTSMEKGIILSSFSCGYFLSPLGGVLSNKYGGVTVFGAGIVITSILTMLSPILVRINRIIFMLGRVLEGVAEGCASAAFMDIFLQWAPPDERSRMIGITNSGFSFGAGIAYPVSGYAAALFGWEAMFTITGGISVLWYLIWYISVSNYPSADKFIKKKEKIYLAKTVISPQSVKITYPWKSILTSIPVWAFLNERLVEACLISFTMYCIPLYIKDVLNMTIGNISLISSVPNFASFLGLSIGSFAMDYVRNKKIMSISNVHKLFVSVSKILSFIILLIIILWMDFKGTIICFTLFRLCSSISGVSSSVLPVDIAPHHASFLTGVSSIFYTLGSFANPIILGLLVKNHTMEEWNQYFGLLCGINLWGGVIFYIFGSGELQPWATPKKLESVDSEEGYPAEISLHKS